MEFDSAIKTLQLYLDEQSFLKKIASLEELNHIKTPMLSFLLTSKGKLFYLPEDIIFKKGIFSLNDDWVDLDKMSKDRISKNTSQKTSLRKNIIKSSIDLYNNFVNDKMIRSGYWDLFKNCKNIDFVDSILILRRNDDSSEQDDFIIIKGPMNETPTVIPDFLRSHDLLAEYTYLSTPYTRPPRVEHLLSYRDLKKPSKLTWNLQQIQTYLGSIWGERSPSTISSRLKLLFESTVMLVEKNEQFNQLLKVNDNSKFMLGIPSNFIISICGGYARNEYSKTSDLDLLLIHEGNQKQFFQVGKALDNVLSYVPNLELCKMENLTNLNFHENSIPNILQAFLTGDETYLDENQLKEIDKMLDSIDNLRKSPLSSEERKEGISKYCWSIYKSIINMVPIYEKPIGKGYYLRKEITETAKRSLHEIITVLLRVTDSLNDKDTLGENLKICQPYVYESIFKKFSTLTALQDVNTILSILNETSFSSSTIDRFNLAMEKDIITKDQSEKLIQGYKIFSRTKYKLDKDMPIEALEVINGGLRNVIKEVYYQILQNLEPSQSIDLGQTVAYPLLVFSDLHWGLNTKLAKKCLAELKKICSKHQVRSIIIAGDTLNIDRANELEKTDSEGISTITEFSQIQNLLGDPRIHIISGNHDPESFYNKYQRKLKLELDIHFLGNHYQDDKIWIEHGDLNFWKNYQPPLDQFISKFRYENNLGIRKIIVGHNHRIYENVESGFYANGSIGKSFSSILVKDDSIKLLKSPIEYSFDFDKILTDYSGIKNADTSINEFVQDNYDLVEWNEYTTSLAENTNQKKTWIVTESGIPTGIIPFNRVHDVSKLKNIQVFEVAFPIHYTFKLDQTLKEVWEVFSISGDSMLPVMNQEKKIIGTLSIFSVPKPEKEHAETKEASIDSEMESTGNFLTQKIFDRQKKMK